MASITLIRLLFVLSCVAYEVWSDVAVFDTRTGDTMMLFRSLESSFGHALPDAGIKGVAIQAHPLNACKIIEPPPKMPYSGVVPIAVIARFGCSFDEKLANARLANYSAAIIFNINSDNLIPMSGDDQDALPAVFIGYTNAEILLRKYSYPSNPWAMTFIAGEGSFNFNQYLLPFVIVVGICFVVMLGILLFKCFRDYRRSGRHRLPRSALKKIPLIKFKTSDPYETCCICLDDFTVGEKLRVLPCDHAYHSKCIDPWLVKNKRICPQCRKRVFPPDSEDAGSGSDSDSADERTPLIHPQPSSRRPFIRGHRRLSQPNSFNRIDEEPEVEIRQPFTYAVGSPRESARSPQDSTGRLQANVVVHAAAADLAETAAAAIVESGADEANSSADVSTTVREKKGTGRGKRSRRNRAQGRENSAFTDGAAGGSTAEENSAIAGNSAAVENSADSTTRNSAVEEGRNSSIQITTAEHSADSTLKNSTRPETENSDSTQNAVVFRGSDEAVRDHEEV